MSDPSGTRDATSGTGAAAGPARTEDSMAHVDSHGAVDLSAVGHAAAAPHQEAPDGGPVTAGLDVPLITEVTEADFESVMAMRKT